MSSGPRVTAAALLAALVGGGVLTHADLTSLLGSERTQPSVNTVEMAVVAAGILTRDDLLALKSQLTGLPAYTSASPAVTDYLDQKTAQRHGALVLDTPSPTVVLVEDTPENVHAVCQALGVTQFDLYITTAPAFADLLKQAYRGQAATRLQPCPDIHSLLDEAVTRRASDVHIKAGTSPRLRVNGYLETLDIQPLTRAWVTSQIRALASDRHWAELDETHSTDFGYTFGNVRFRVNVARDIDGDTLALRRLPNSIPTADDLNLPQAIRDLAQLERGLVLVTGPTGSGKSTTLAALLGIVVHGSSRHLITLEDPIEYRFPTDRAAHVNQRELGSSFPSFPEGLRDALRQDPDVILVGELRDTETIRTAITAADTGHLVFGTLHTYDAPTTIMRLVNAFPAGEQDAVRAQLSMLLRGVVSQTLVPKAAGSGRIAAFEILLNTIPVSANLRKVDGHRQIRQSMQAGLSDGMVTMEASLAQLVVTGVISRAEGEFRSRDLDEFTRMLDYYAHLPRT